MAIENSVSRTTFTHADRASEVAQVLTTGLLRYLGKSSPTEKVSLALSPNQSVHGQPKSQENKR